MSDLANRLRKLRDDLDLEYVDAWPARDVLDHLREAADTLEAMDAHVSDWKDRANMFESAFAKEKDAAEECERSLYLKLDACERQRDVLAEALRTISQRTYDDDF